MEIPAFDALLLPFLRTLDENHRVSLVDVTSAIATRLELSEVALSELLPSGKQTKLYSRVGWARTYLSKAGLIATVSKGVFELTAAGKQLLASNPPHLDKNDLLQYASFRAWIEESKSGSSHVPGAGHGVPSAIEAVSPEEAIAEGHKQLESALADEVLDALLGVTWQRFEMIVVDVLEALGYGGNREGAGRAFMTSGDGGVDGVIDEDPLGLSKVYVQAKKYKLDSTIGRPDVQAFVGSLFGKRSKQGVFITTCKFSNDARAYVAGLSDPRVVLVDGQRLARLMINGGVGVVEQDRFVIRRLDREYFEL